MDEDCDDFDNDSEEHRSIWNEFLELANDGIVQETEDGHVSTMIVGLPDEARENPVVDWVIGYHRRPEKYLPDLNLLVVMGLDDAGFGSGTVTIPSEKWEIETRVTVSIEPHCVPGDVTAWPGETSKHIFSLEVVNTGPYRYTQERDTIEYYHTDCVRQINTSKTHYDS